MSDITIAPATTEADLEAVRQLCWDYRTFLWNASEVDRRITETFYPVEKYEAVMAQLHKLHARPSGIILLARDGAGQPIGCGMTQPLDDTCIEIKRVFVAPIARGKGVARKLCESLISRARDDGYDRIVLDTSEALTAAQALYTDLGFARRGPYQPVPDHILPHLYFYERAL